VRSSSELVELFRREGLRITPQRQQIFKVLSGNTVHPTAEWVWHSVRTEMPSVSLKTVYDTLHELVSLGELQRLDLGTGAGRFDPNVSEHHHLVCRRCGRVQDLHADFSSLEIPAPQRNGFQASNAEVVFRGLCHECSLVNQGQEQ
jgi:Fe2+ or Zn2+ uptake regulation protein